MAFHPEVDDIDLKIISLLMEDAQMPYTEIAKKVFVSGGTVHVRMKKLINLGIVALFFRLLIHSKDTLNQTFG